MQGNVPSQKWNEKRNHAAFPQNACSASIFSILDVVGDPQSLNNISPLGKKQNHKCVQDDFPF